MRFDSSPPNSALPLSLAELAVFWYMRKSLLLEELLFSRRKHKHHAAIHTQHISVSKAHTPPTKQIQRRMPADLKKSEASIFLVDDLIAFASSVCKAHAILDRHMATRIRDQSGLVQHACRHGDSGATRTQHHSEEFVRDGQMIALHSVVASSATGPDALRIPVHSGEEAIKWLRRSGPTY